MQWCENIMLYLSNVTGIDTTGWFSTIFREILSETMFALLHTKELLERSLLQKKWICFPGSRETKPSRPGCLPSKCIRSPNFLPWFPQPPALQRFPVQHSEQNFNDFLVLSKASLFSCDRSVVSLALLMFLLPVIGGDTQNYMNKLYTSLFLAFLRTIRQVILH